MPHPPSTAVSNNREVNVLFLSFGPTKKLLLLFFISKSICFPESQRLHNQMCFAGAAAPFWCRPSFNKADQSENSLFKSVAMSIQFERIHTGFIVCMYIYVCVYTCLYTHTQIFFYFLFFHTHFFYFSFHFVTNTLSASSFLAVFPFYYSQSCHHYAAPLRSPSTSGVSQGQRLRLVQPGPMCV